MSSFIKNIKESNQIVIIETDGYLNNEGGEAIAAICYEKIKGGQHKFSILGIYIDYILKGGYIVKLFQMKNYYVKSYYHIKKNKLVRIVVIDDPHDLKPFLKIIYINANS